MRSHLLRNLNRTLLKRITEMELNVTILKSIPYVPYVEVLTEISNVPASKVGCSLFAEVV